MSPFFIFSHNRAGVSVSNRIDGLRFANRLSSSPAIHGDASRREHSPSPVHRVQGVVGHLEKKA
jgi:hypothetical protein